MDFARLFLEYIKALVWPIILCIVLAGYGPQIFEILKTRDVNAFGLSVSGSLDSLEQNYEQEIADLKRQIAAMEGGNSETKDQLISKLDNISGNVRQELSTLRVEVQNPSETVISNKKLLAQAAERRGFEAIVDGDVTQALAEFSAAKEYWPTYHNVSEIHALLQRNSRTLTTPAEWAKLCSTIIDQYSWGIPADLRPAMERKSNVLTLRR